MKRPRGSSPGPGVSAHPKQYPAQGEQIEPTGLKPQRQQRTSSSSPSTDVISMSHKTKRRTSSTISAFAQDNFWSTIAAYSSELAHVAGPLLEAIGHTAKAIERAERPTRALEAAWEELEE